MTELWQIAVVASTAAAIGAFVAASYAAKKARQATEAASRINKRFDELGEQNVRAIMEEGGEASVEAVLRTFDRLRNGDILSDKALEQARAICKR